MKRFFFFLFGPVGYSFVSYKNIVTLNLINDVTNNFWDRVGNEAYLLYWAIWLLLVAGGGLGLLSASFSVKSKDLPNPLLILVEVILLYYITRWTYYLGFYKEHNPLEILAGIWTLIIGPIQLIIPLLPMITLMDSEQTENSQSSSDSYESPISTRVSTYTNIKGRTTRRTTNYYGKGRKDITDERIN